MSTPFVKPKVRPTPAQKMVLAGLADFGLEFGFGPNYKGRRGSIPLATAAVLERNGWAEIRAVSQKAHGDFPDWVEGRITDAGREALYHRRVIVTAPGVASFTDFGTERVALDLSCPPANMRSSETRPVPYLVGLWNALTDAPVGAHIGWVVQHERGSSAMRRPFYWEFDSVPRPYEIVVEQAR